MPAIDGNLVINGVSNGLNGNLVGTDIVPIDPKLGVLADNGGPTLTHALLPGSPALDAGDNSFVVDPPFTGPTFFDQRGANFARIVDGPDADVTDTVDIGTFEAQVSVEDIGDVTINVERIGDTTQAVSVDYATPDDSQSATPVSCATVNGIASSRCDFISALGTLEFAAGETSRSFTVLITQDSYVEGTETLDLTLSNPLGGAALGTPATAVLEIADDPSEPPTNPSDDAAAFVRQHYHDFLNREPDGPGLAFWTNEITQCGADADCIEVKRINVSAAFFLSIEFQETGFLVYLTHKTAFGDLAGAPVPITFIDFLADVQKIGQGVQVGVGSWETILEQNKENYMLTFVERVNFLSKYPNTLTAEEFVDQLDLNIISGEYRQRFGP